MGMTSMYALLVISLLCWPTALLNVINHVCKSQVELRGDPEDEPREDNWRRWERRREQSVKWSYFRSGRIKGVHAKDELLPRATGYSGASVPHQKMASLVEEIQFKLSGEVSAWLRENIMSNIFLQLCNFEKIVRIIPLYLKWLQCCHIIANQL